MAMHNDASRTAILYSSDMNRMHWLLEERQTSTSGLLRNTLEEEGMIKIFRSILTSVLNMDGELPCSL